jgi:serine/threonine protein kinase
MPGLADRLIELTPAQMDDYRIWTDAYESAWNEARDSEPEPDGFLPDQDPPASLVLVQNVKVALEYCSRNGKKIQPESLLERFPRIAGDDEARIEVLAWGSRLADQSPGSAIETFALPSLAERFPTLRDAIVERRSTYYREQGGAFPPELVPDGSTLIHELPRGGMSRLALVWNESVKREEVLKLIDPVCRDNPEAMERFRREFQLAGDRPGGRVVPVYRAGSVLGHLYYTMPHLRGASLRDRLRQKGVPLREGVAMLVEVSRAVHALHTQKPQLIHRDLKPENILFSGSDLSEPWIADLGLARLIAETADPALTGPGTECLGTPGYMAPEQIRDDAHKAGPVADIHALGAILYELLTGRPPFFDPSRSVAIRRTQEQDPLRPSGLTTVPVPADLEVLALKALRKDPAERFRSAADLADELSRWLEGVPIKSRPPSAWSRVRSLARRYPRTTAASVLVTLLLLGLSALSFYLFMGERAQRKRARQTALQVVGPLSRQVEGLARPPGRKSLRPTPREQSESLRDLASALDFVVRENEGIGSLELGSALNGLAAARLQLGEVPAALEASRRAEDVAASLPPSWESHYGVASAQLQTGRLLFREGKIAEGEASTRKAVEGLRLLVAERPENLDARARLAVVEVNLGNFARGDRPDESAAQYRRALEHWEILCRPETVQPRFLEWYARTLSNLGLLMAEQKDPAGAVPILKDAVLRAEKLVELVGEERDALDSLAASRLNLGETLAKAGQPAQALAVLDGAIQTYGLMASRFPGDTEGPWGVALGQTTRAQAMGLLGRWKEAVPLLETAQKGLESVRKILPDDPELASQMEEHQALLAQARKELAAGR